MTHREAVLASIGPDQAVRDSLQILKDQHAVDGQVQQAQTANVSLY
jgi:hypothetical protein